MAETQTEQDETPSAESHDPAGGEERGGRRGAQGAAKKAPKLSVAVADDSPLAELANSLKERGAKVDVGELLREALEQVPESWWESQREELTPLEYKIQMALKDPSMREKLSSFLAQPAP